MMIPYEKLKSLESAKDFLKPSLSFEQLDKVAYRVSDNKSGARFGLSMCSLLSSSPLAD
jgi:hypothetical protein